jgi:hypothetical protein
MISFTPSLLMSATTMLLTGASRSLLSFGMIHPRLIALGSA